MTAPSTPYRRILLKLSGEALLGGKDFGIDDAVLEYICSEIESVRDLGVEIVIVIGAGNIWRGADRTDSPIDRVSSDYIGMLGTIMNSVALQASLEKHGFESRVCSTIDVPAVAEPYIKRRAAQHLQKGRIVVCAGGTGNPFFTTDSAAALRGLELACDIVLKATNVDGVYDADPRTHPEATKYQTVTFAEVLQKGLRVMDATAIAQCRDHGLPITVFKLMEAGNLRRVLTGEPIGTTIVKQR